MKFTKRLGLSQITVEKRFWKTIKPLLSGNCIQPCVLAFINNKNVFSDDYELEQALNNYFYRVVEKLGIK